MRDYKKLKVWEKSHKLTLSVYQSTKSYPSEELYGLVSQMRRCSSSIPSNIAEGCGRNTQPQFGHHLNIASGSASELEYQVLLSRDLGFINNETFKELTLKVGEVKRMLSSLQKWWHLIADC